MAQQMNDFVLGVNNMTGVAVITSPVINSRHCKKISFQNSWTGNPTGTFQYQGTNNRLALDNPSDPRITWTPLTIAVTHGTAAPAGAASSNATVITDLLYYTRFQYTNTGGTGSLKTDIDMDKR